MIDVLYRIRSFQEPPVESSPLKCPALREKNGCGCSSCFCCHSEVIATQHPIIDRTLQNLRAFEKPESQQEGLETFLESISRKDLSGGNVRLAIDSNTPSQHMHCFCPCYLLSATHQATDVWDVF